MRVLFAVALLLTPLPGHAAEFFTLKGHGGPIMDVAAAEDGRIITASFDNSVGLWSDGQASWLEGHEAAVNTVLFSRGQLWSAGDDFTLRRWLVPATPGEVVGRHKGKIVGLAASRDHIATASWDGTIGLWPHNPGGPPRFLTGHESGVNAVYFSSDGTQLYSAGMDGTLRLWDVASGTEIRQVVRHGFGLNRIVLNPSGGWLAYGAVDGATRVINLQTDEKIADFTLDRRPILALALSPDGTRLAVGDGEGFIMLVDTEAWAIARDFRATLRGPVWALAFSPDGQSLHAGGLDNALYSWPVDSLGRHSKISTDKATFLQDPAKMDNGERQFMRKCSICHALTPDGQRRAGPTLHGVFGRRAGTLDGYRFSAALDGSPIIWDDDSINALFHDGPDNYIPGTKMPMQRITDPRDRADLIAFLRRATTKGDSQ